MKTHTSMFATLLTFELPKKHIESTGESNYPIYRRLIVMQAAIRRCSIKKYS